VELLSSLDRDVADLTRALSGYLLGNGG